MASTASDSSQPSPGASAFLDNHPLFLDATAGGSSFFPAAATASQEQPPLAPTPAASSSAARKPPRKRPRASRRPPTTVVTTDTSNFRAMVQEFTGIPAPPPHLGLGPGGVLFGAPQHGDYAVRGPFDLLMRPSPLKLGAAPSASPPAGSFAHSLFANSGGGGANPPAVSSSESYGGGFAPAFSGAVVPRYDGGFDAGEDERHDHGLFSSFLHAGDRYHHSHH